MLKVETPAQQLFFSTLRIETQSRVGTGAIVNHEWQEGQMGPFLVTNKHVISDAEQVTLAFTAGQDTEDGRRPVLGSSQQVQIDDCSGLWVGHPTPEIDIAVMPLSLVHDLFREKSINVFYRGISTDLVPVALEDANIDAVEEILFVGYPSGIYDRANNLPIARKGITATPYSVDYEGSPAFLIDASVFPGSSGSPVFLHDVGLAGQRFHWLGILASVYQRQDDGIVRFEEIPADVRPVLKTTQMIDLGVVYKSQAVVETIEHLLRQRGALPPLGGEAEAAS